MLTASGIAALSHVFEANMGCLKEAICGNFPLNFKILFKCPSVALEPVRLLKCVLCEGAQALISQAGAHQIRVERAESHGRRRGRAFAQLCSWLRLPP